MYEKWKTEFFEWKDGIEVKFNNLSQKNIELENKFEEHLKDDSEEIRNELARQVDLISENMEQIADIRKHNDARFVDIVVPLTHRFVNLETVLRESFQAIIGAINKDTGIGLLAGTLEGILEKLDSSKQPEIDMIGKLLENAKKVVDKVEQMEKKDSEVLKDIKELAKAESDFYNKHGYFSFWSDQLKIQRIKELKNKKGSEGEKDVSEVDETGGATPTRNVELDTSSLLGDDSKPPESKHTCPICQEEISLETEFDCPTCESEITLKEIVDSGKKEVIEVYEGEYEKVTDPITRVTNYLKKEPKEKELYELYLKDKEQYYFKKITHPFTELNNMVHRGMGMKLMPYDTEEKLIEEFIKKIEDVEMRSVQINIRDLLRELREEYEGMLNK